MSCAAIALLEVLHIERETIVGGAHAENGKAGGNGGTTINAVAAGRRGNARVSACTVTALAKHDHQRDRRQKKPQERPVVEGRVDEIDEAGRENQTDRQHRIAPLLARHDKRRGKGEQRKRRVRFDKPSEITRRVDAERRTNRTGARAGRSRCGTDFRTERCSATRRAIQTEAPRPANRSGIPNP